MGEGLRASPDGEQEKHIRARFVDQHGVPPPQAYALPTVLRVLISTLECVLQVESDAPGWAGLSLPAHRFSASQLPSPLLAGTQDPIRATCTHTHTSPAG